MERYKSRNRLCLGLVVLAVAFLSGCGSGTSATPETWITNTANVLVAQYNVDAFASANVWVEFGPDTSYGRQTSSFRTASDGFRKVAVLVAGMKANTTYHMRAHVDYLDGRSWIDEDHLFNTGSLPANNALKLTVTRPSPSLHIKQSGVELLDVLAPYTDNLGSSVADLNGNVIWYYNSGPGNLFPFPIKILPDGNILLNVVNLREVDLAGTTVRKLSVDELNDRLRASGYPALPIIAIHHDVCVLPNGHLILLTETTKTFTDLPGYPGTIDVVGDVLIDLDSDWNPVWVWSTFDHLDINRHLMGLPDWTHSNAVIYSPNDGNLMLSMRHQSWVIKIDYQDGSGAGDIVWRLGNQGDFSLSGGDPSQWFYAQHFPKLESQTGSQMVLSIFDNGNLREDDIGTQCAGLYPACFSRAVLVKLDESARTAQVQWQDTPGLYSSWGGSIGILDNGDVEFDMTAPYGPTTPASRILEVTQTASPKIVWQLDINGGNAYRAYRIPSLYPGVTWNQ